MTYAPTLGSASPEGPSAIGTKSNWCVGRARRIESLAQRAVEARRYGEICYRFMQARTSLPYFRNFTVVSTYAAYACLVFSFIPATNWLGRVNQIGLTLSAHLNAAVAVPHSYCEERFASVRAITARALADRFGSDFVDQLSQIELSSDGLDDAIQLLENACRRQGIEVNLDLIKEKAACWEDSPMPEPLALLNHFGGLLVPARELVMDEVAGKRAAMSDEELTRDMDALEQTVPGCRRLMGLISMAGQFVPDLIAEAEDMRVGRGRSEIEHLYDVPLKVLQDDGWLANGRPVNPTVAMFGLGMIPSDEIEDIEDKMARYWSRIA